MTDSRSPRRRPATFLRATAAGALAALSVLFGVSFADLVAHDRPSQSVSAGRSAATNATGSRYERARS